MTLGRWAAGTVGLIAKSPLGAHWSWIILTAEELQNRVVPRNFKTSLERKG